MNKKVDESEQFAKVYGVTINLKKLDAIIVRERLRSTGFECFGVANETTFNIYVDNYIRTDEIDKIFKDNDAFIKIKMSYFRKDNVLFYNDSDVSFNTGNTNTKYSIKI